MEEDSTLFEVAKVIIAQREKAHSIEGQYHRLKQIQVPRKSNGEKKTVVIPFEVLTCWNNDVIPSANNIANDSADKPAGQKPAPELRTIPLSSLFERTQSKPSGLAFADGY